MNNHSSLQKNKTTIRRTAAVFAALLLWQVFAMILHKKVLLASPIDVIKTLFLLIPQKIFWSSIGHSFFHILLGLTLGIIIGILFSLLSHKYPLLEILLWPYVSLIKTVPVASFIILCLVWIPSRYLSIFISFLIVFPLIYVNLLNGLKNLDSGMEDMAKIYQIHGRQKILFIYLPQMKPYLESSLLLAIGMAWKSGIAAEVIGMSQGSIGKMLYQAKLYLATPELFAWTLVIVLISVSLEKLLLYLLHYCYTRLENQIWISTCKK